MYNLKDSVLKKGVQCKWLFLTVFAQRFTTIDPHSENYYSISPYVYVGNNPMRLIDPTGMDWFVNNENGNMYYLKGVSQLTDKQREQYNMGSSKYENLGKDKDFGYGMEYGEGKDHKGKLLDQEFVSVGVYSEEFMNKHGYDKAYRNRVEETTQITTTPNEANPMFDVITEITDNPKILGKTEHTYAKPENMYEKRNLKSTTESPMQEMKIRTTVYTILTPTMIPSNKNNGASINTFNTGLSIIGDLLNALFQ